MATIYFKALFMWEGNPYVVSNITGRATWNSPARILHPIRGKHVSELGVAPLQVSLDKTIRTIVPGDT